MSTEVELGADAPLRSVVVGVRRVPGTSSNAIERGRRLDVGAFLSSNVLMPIKVRVGGRR